MRLIMLIPEGVWQRIPSFIQKWMMSNIGEIEV